jgi:hypothetical protein
MRQTHGLAGGDGKDFGGHADGALDAQVLVLGTVDKVGADWGARLSVESRARCQERDSPFSRFLTLREVRVMRILWALAAGKPPS